MKTDIDFRVAAAKFLKRPILNTLRFSLSSGMARLPLLSRSRKNKLQASADKRDFAHISDGLLESSILASRVAAPAPVPVELETINRRDFRNSRVPVRGKVLGSDWHLALHSSLTASETDDLPAITLSLVTYNSERWLEGFMQSLLDQNFPLEKLNVRVADHGSSDGTVAAFARFFELEGARFASCALVERENLGFGAGHDFNIQSTDDAFALVSNVDLKLAPDSILHAVRFASRDDADIACWELRQCPYEHPKYYDPITLEAAWCSHACILIRRTHYTHVGGYDQKIFMYGEDVELSYRFRGAGFRLRYLPQVYVTHFVDFEDTGLRPHQLTGSLSANILLRYRYLGKDAAKEAEDLLQAAIDVEGSRDRLSALEAAQERVARDREHFCTQHQPTHDAPFPFNDFDYELTRDGFDQPLDSTVSLEILPKVTIITRTHGDNIAPLREAIASVLNQTYPNIEHLIVEDRSDFAGELVHSVAKTYGADIRYVRSNGGSRSFAGNDGLAAAQGDVLMFLDNDDFLFCDHVELLVRALADAPEAAAAYALAWDTPAFFTASSGRYREGEPSLPSSHRQDYAKERFEEGNFIPIQAILFRRGLYDQFGGFDPVIDHLEDWNLWTRYAEGGPFVLVPKLTSVYKTPGDPFFRHERQVIMLAAEPSVRKITFGSKADPR